MIPGAAYHPTAITGSFTAATAGERSADWRRTSGCAPSGSEPQGGRDHRFQRVTVGPPRTPSQPSRTSVSIARSWTRRAPNRVPRA